MIYLSGIHSKVIAEHAATDRRLGLMMQPKSATVQHQNLYPWQAFDNGAFGAYVQGKDFDAATWQRQLIRVRPGPDFLFAVVPDVVGDHAGTVQSWQQHAGTVLDAGLPAAFVLQNGCTDIGQVPAGASAIFIGGDDTYKLGPDAARVTWQARNAGLWTHMGRCNSAVRFRRALAMGCDSVDGTFLRFGNHARQLDRVLAWFAAGRDLGGQLHVTDVA